MRVKRYVVDSMPDALQKIRTDLGKDAVILNTKEVRSGGFLGFFAKKKIEVIAATDSSVSSPTGGASASTASSKASAAPRPAIPQGMNPYAAAMKKSQTAPASAQVALLDEDLPKTGEDKHETFVQAAPKQAPPETLAAAPITSSPAPAVSAGMPREDALLEEIKQMKEMMFKLSHQQKVVSKLPPALQTLEERLLAQEVEPMIVQQLIERVQAEAEEQGGAEITETFAVDSVRRQLMDLLKSSRSKHIAPETKVAHFVGPTGVGKTTTIAKLAAEQVLKYQRKVGFITSDTYRIAAVDQLRTYATILNVPLEVVFSPQDLTKAFKQLEDRDIIFMDTAGRNFRNEMYVSELNALLQSKGASETFLALSLTTKYKDMKAIAGNFSKFKLDKVLFTKMDETDSYGAIVNIVKDFGLQLSYVTNGQSVPDDIIEVDEMQIIDQLLEEHSNE
ncbi:flagellar biosynthesis protein FlhF [Paenibacillus hamazuiensis]|uniref:flagellar biosynthesis protein FlhF n=1 Tax=Paenibacillus hamazuiensis TaxID=2936508 RepID=UPI00200DE28E|nr:flagellar biosynthesis protein FlhF [Paenibacillus hamazuiensis]